MSRQLPTDESQSTNFIFAVVRSKHDRIQWCSSAWRLEQARKKIINYRRIYAELPESVVFMPVAVNTAGRIYEIFLRLLFLQANRDASSLAGELPEESVPFAWRWLLG